MLTTELDNLPRLDQAKSEGAGQKLQTGWPAELLLLTSFHHLENVV